MVNPVEHMRDTALSSYDEAKEQHEELLVKVRASAKELAAKKASYEAYEDAYQAVESASTKPKRKRLSKASSGASDDTKKLFSALYSAFRHNKFSYDDIENYALVAGLQINMTTMRSNTSDYVRNGHLDRPENGVFKITESGMKFFGIPIPEPTVMPGMEGFSSGTNERLARIRRRREGQ